MGMTFLFLCRRGSLWRLFLNTEENWTVYIQPCSSITPCLPRYAARFDCGCRYELRVRLLSEDYIVLDDFHPEPVVIEQWNDAMWREVSSSPVGSSFTSVLWHLNLVSLTWPKVPSGPTFSALQPPLLNTKGKLILAVDNAEEVIVPWKS